MKKKILIIGTGGHAGSCLDVINSSKELSIYGLIAKSKSEKSKLSGHKIVGTENDLEKLFNHIKYAFIAFGNIKSFQRRLTLYNKLKKIGYKLPTVISKFAHVSKNSIIGEGTIIMHGTFVNSGSKIWRAGQGDVSGAGALMKLGDELAALFTGTNLPNLPSFKISFGPLGQSVETICFFRAKASTRTNPNPSLSDDKTNIEAFLISGNGFDL